MPTQEELRRVLYSDRTPLRTRCSVALMAFSGVRYQTMGSYDGTDGLVVGDFPELEVKSDTVVFRTVPA